MPCLARPRDTLKERPVLNYPGRWSGIGLLLLRGTVGVTVAAQARLSLVSPDVDALAVVPGVGLILCGVALTLGVLTPACSTLVGLGYALVLFTPFGAAVLPHLDAAAAVLGLAASAGLVFLGPGAFSIDARVFGRREIFIPAAHRSKQP